ncbi:MAG: hypothetical protein NC116_11355 [Clostridium sp.]|nr:hypothetical protein [Clostridium sp.]
MTWRGMDALCIRATLAFVPAVPVLLSSCQQNQLVLSLSLFSLKKQGGGEYAAGCMTEYA